jgi:hypothetical protein
VKNPADQTKDDRELHVVTGAFGYSGRFITERLLKTPTL